MMCDRSRGVLFVSKQYNATLEFSREQTPPGVVVATDWGPASGPASG